MIADEFNANEITAVNFGVRLRSTGNLYFVPTNLPVQSALQGILQATISAFNNIEGGWEEHDVSEDYGKPRRVYTSRQGELMAGLSALFEASSPPDLSNLDQQLADLNVYFGVFWDSQGRKAVGIKRAVQFKGTLGAQNKLMRLVDDTLELIPEKVLKLDQEFDAIMTDRHIFMLKVSALEHIGDLVKHVAEAAQAKVQAIHDAVPFLDFSRVKEKIKNHPRMARLACAVAAKPDLGRLNRNKIVQAAHDHGITFSEVNGRLQCNTADETKLLEILDARRFRTDLTEEEPVPYRATSRQKVAR